MKNYEKVLAVAMVLGDAAVRYESWSLGIH